MLGEMCSKKLIRTNLAGIWEGWLNARLLRKAKTLSPCIVYLSVCVFANRYFKKSIVAVVLVLLCHANWEPNIF